MRYSVLLSFGKHSSQLRPPFLVPWKYASAYSLTMGITWKCQFSYVLYCISWVLSLTSCKPKARISIFRAEVKEHCVAACSGLTPRYDKPSLKVGWTVKVCQPLAQGGDKSRQTTQAHWRVLQAYVLYSRTRRGDQTVRSRSGTKRTSWIVRATILGFIYTWEVLLSNLSRSMYSK